MNIRLAKKSDYKKLMNLFNLFICEDRYSKLNNDSFDKVLKSETNFIYVVEEESKLVGFSTFSVKSVIRYPKPIMEFDELFVIENYRKIGVGKKLLFIMEKKAKELKCYKIFIDSRFDHKIAHKFYQSLGYINYGFHFIKNL